MFSNEMISKTRWAYLLIYLAVIISANLAIKAFGSESDFRKPVISLDVQDGALTDVLERLSKASGYKIILNGDWEALRVSVKLKNATFEKALNMCLRNFNHAVTWEETEKKVSLFICDSMGSTEYNRASDEIFSRQAVSEFENGISGIGRKRSEHDRSLAVSITGEDTRFVQCTRTTIE